ncbi:MAG TPA: hypothetical protein VLJ59_16975 [Mycobacteriales bacterium]|nr:hypothetical protein [Mycobacteriales bacterium]
MLDIPTTSAADQARRHNAALDAEITKALDEMVACRAAQVQVARAARELDGVPSVGAAAAGTRFTSPAASRLRTELSGMDGSVRSAAGRLGALVGLLARGAREAELRASTLAARKVPGVG